MECRCWHEITLLFIWVKRCVHVVEGLWGTSSRTRMEGDYKRLGNHHITQECEVVGQPLNGDQITFIKQACYIFNDPTNAQSRSSSYTQSSPAQETPSDNARVYVLNAVAKNKMIPSHVHKDNSHIGMYSTTSVKEGRVETKEIAMVSPVKK